jgi:hypothetical protein
LPILRIISEIIPDIPQNLSALWNFHSGFS